MKTKDLIWFWEVSGKYWQQVSTNVTMICNVIQLLCMPSGITTSKNDITETEVHRRVRRMVKSFEMITCRDMEAASIDCLKKGLQSREHDKSTSNKEEH